MLFALLLACSPAPTAAPVPAEAAAATHEDADAHEAHEAAEAREAAEAGAPGVALGEPFTATDVVPADRLVAESALWDGKEVVVEGVVKEVCQKKGCWHTIATADPAVSILAKDKEYKIFLPKDAAGKRVQVKGTFATKDLPEAEARHYAEDAGKDPNTIVGPQKSFSIDVAGVRFLEG